MEVPRIPATNSSEWLDSPMIQALVKAGRVKAIPASHTIGGAPLGRGMAPTHELMYSSPVSSLGILASQRRVSPVDRPLWEQ